MDVIVQSGHQNNVIGVEFAPDGRSLASCGADESVRLWDLGLGCEAAVLQGHRGPVYHLAYSADGALLASGGWDHEVRIWDVGSRSCARVLSGITRHVVDALALSANGARAAATGIGVQDTPRQLIVWDVATGATAASLDVPGNVSGRSTALALSADGGQLAFADAHGHVDLLDVATGDRRLLLSDLDAVGGLAFTPDGATLFVLTRQLLRVDPATGAIRSAQDIPEPVKAAAEPEEEGGVQPLGPLFHLSMQADGTPVVYSGDATHLFGPEPRSLPIPCSAVAPDGALLARTAFRDVELVDAASGQVVRRLGGRLRTGGFVGNMHRQFVLATSPTEPLVATAATDGLVRLWDLARSPSPTLFSAHDGTIDALAFSPQGTLLASAGLDRLRVWPRSGGPPALDLDVGDGARTVAFSAEGSAIVLGTWQKAVRTIEVDGGAEITAVSLEHGPEAVAVSPWNDVAVGTFEDARIWRPFLTGDPTVIATPMTCNQIDFADDGRVALALGYFKWMAFAQDSIPGAGVVLRPGGGEPTVLRGHLSSVTCIRFSPDDALIATGAEDGEVRIWDAETGECLHQITAHAGTVTGIGWLPDGARLASIGYDGIVRLWEPGTGGLVATLLSLGDQDYAAVTPDGHYSATRAALAAIVLRTDTGLHPFEQFDLQLNRPDLLLSRIGYASAAMVRAYAEAHERRLARLGLGPTREVADVEQPVLEVLTPPPPVSATGRLVLQVRLTPGGHPLSHLYLTVGDVPVDGRAGRKVPPAGGLIEIDTGLTPGDNELALWCSDDAGSLSQRVGYRVFDARPAPSRRLFVLTAGVSRYARPGLTLEFAAKDARDLAEELRSRAHSFAEVRTRVLPDATREQILAAPAFLAEARLEDHVVVLLAGHGALLGTDFAFLPSDADPGDLAGTAIRYEDIEGLVDGLPARRRLILLDTCHSGEDDLGPPPAAPPTALATGVVRGRSFTRREMPAEVAAAGQPLPVQPPADRPSVRLHDIFADLRQESGAFVIAAAGFAEFALERDDLRNGVFTASVIQALRTDPDLTVTALATEVARRVTDLTGGRQRPMVRRENLADDYRVL
jgi:WD40 repeat protein